MVANLVIHVITWITAHLPTPEGWKAELSIVPDWFRTHENETENVPVSVKLHLNGQTDKQSRGVNPVFTRLQVALNPHRMTLFLLRPK